MLGTPVREKDAGNTCQREGCWEHFQWKGCWEHIVSGILGTSFRKRDVRKTIREKDPANVCQREGCWKHAIRKGDSGNRPSERDLWKISSGPLNTYGITCFGSDSPQFPQAFIPLLISSVQAVIQGMPSTYRVSATCQAPVDFLLLILVTNPIEERDIGLAFQMTCLRQ